MLLDAQRGCKHGRDSVYLWAQVQHKAGGAFDQAAQRGQMARHHRFVPLLDGVGQQPLQRLDGAERGQCVGFARLDLGEEDAAGCGLVQPDVGPD